MGSFTRLSPYSVESDAISGYILSELDGILRYRAGVQALLGLGCWGTPPPTLELGSGTQKVLVSVDL